MKLPNWLSSFLFTFEVDKATTLFYDCETANSFPEKVQNTRLTYEDFRDMGISVICAYTSWTQRYHVFLEDNLKEFQSLIDTAKVIVGFNSISFDDKLCSAHDLSITTTYDLLCQVRVAAGMPSHYVKGVTRKGYGLNQLAKANFNLQKTSSGELAPQLWQQGKQGQVIDYCLNDVMILKKLYDKRNKLIDPTNGKTLSLID